MTYVKKTEVVISEEHFANCKKCGSGQGLREVFPDGRVKEYGNEEAENSIGQPCKTCGTIIELEVWNNTITEGGYHLVNCHCGKEVHIRYDGQQCSCGQMYNAVGQRITHRGYDSFGDTDDYDF